LLPKLYNNEFMSVLVYTIAFVTCYYVYTHGGIESTAKSLMPNYK